MSGPEEEDRRSGTRREIEEQWITRSNVLPGARSRRLATKIIGKLSPLTRRFMRHRKSRNISQPIWHWATECHCANESARLNSRLCQSSGEDPGRSSFETDMRFYRDLLVRSFPSNSTSGVLLEPELRRFHTANSWYFNARS